MSNLLLNTYGVTDYDVRTGTAPIRVQGQTLFTIPDGTRSSIWDIAVCPVNKMLHVEKCWIYYAQGAGTPARNPTTLGIHINARAGQSQLPGFNQFLRYEDRVGGWGLTSAALRTSSLTTGMARALVEIEDVYVTAGSALSYFMDTGADNGSALITTAWWSGWIFPRGNVQT